MFSLFGSKSNGTAFRRIGVSEFESMRSAGNAITLIDVREPFELSTFGAIPGVVNIPLGQLKQRTGNLPADKASTIVTICQSGQRSQQAAALIGAMGYSNVFSLDGGTLGWLKSVRR
jgi:rhodanese-related sulfurtransferase